MQSLVVYFRLTPSRKLPRVISRLCFNCSPPSSDVCNRKVQDPTCIFFGMENRQIIIYKNGKSLKKTRYMFVKQYAPAATKTTVLLS